MTCWAPVDGTSRFRGPKFPTRDVFGATRKWSLLSYPTAGMVPAARIRSCPKVPIDGQLGSIVYHADFPCPIVFCGGLQRPISHSVGPNIASS
jgi:hypothetical protein